MKSFEISRQTRYEELWITSSNIFFPSSRLPAFFIPLFTFSSDLISKWEELINLIPTWRSRGRTSWCCWSRRPGTWRPRQTWRPPSLILCSGQREHPWQCPSFQPKKRLFMVLTLILLTIAFDSSEISPAFLGPRLSSHKVWEQCLLIHFYMGIHLLAFF